MHVLDKRDVPLHPNHFIQLETFFISLENVFASSRYDHFTSWKCFLFHLKRFLFSQYTTILPNPEVYCLHLCFVSLMSFHMSVWFYVLFLVFSLFGLCMLFIVHSRWTWKTINKAYMIFFTMYSIYCVPCVNSINQKQWENLYFLSKLTNL